MGLRGSIGEQAIFLIPAQFAYGVGAAVRGLTIHLRSRAMSIGVFEFARVTQRLDKLQCNDRGASVRILRRLASLEVFGPIPKDPPRQSPQQPIRALSPQ